MRGRLTAAALLSVAVAGAATVALSRAGGAAGGEETYPAPAGGSYTFAGHGNGHGHGMSQYGARNRAEAGQSATQILNFYYPGTTALAADPAGLLRVRLTLQGEEPLMVAAAAGLTVRDSATGSDTPLGATGRYRVVDGNTTVSLQVSTGGGVWTTVTLTGGATSTTGTLTFSGPALLRLVHTDGTARDYAGALSGGPSGGLGLRSVNVVGLDEYVAGVVPAEVFSSWPAATLQAQAVAARTFAAHERADRPTNWYHTCDTAACQAYGGRYSYAADGTRSDLQPASVRAAVTATSGQLRGWQGAPAYTQFSASNGGWTSADPAYPYLVAAADPYDLTDNPYANWTATVPAATIASCLLPGATLARLVVTARDGHGDWGGRVTGVRTEGTTGGTAATDGDGLRRCAGLRSVYFTVTSTWLMTTEPAGVRDSHGGVDVFATGPAGDVLHRRYVVNHGWQPWTSLGGAVLGSPGVLRLPDGSARAYVRGTNNALYEGTVDAAGAFHGWASRAAGVTSRPYPVRQADGSVLVFYGTGTQLGYLKLNPNNTSGGTFALGGVLLPAVAPAAAVTGSGQVTVLAAASSGAIVSRSLAAGHWGGWTNLGGASGADLGAASPSAGVLDLYLRGTNGALYARRAVTGRWGGWTNLGGALSTGTFAAALAGNTGVWTVGTAGGAYYRDRTTAGLGPWYALP
jgi:stage II sporulation protein D